MHVSGPQVFTYNLHAVVQLLHVFTASELFVLFISCIRCWLIWAESVAEPLILYCSLSSFKPFSLLVSHVKIVLVSLYFMLRESMLRMIDS